jgi:hypothetical protein
MLGKMMAAFGLLIMVMAAAPNASDVKITVNGGKLVINGVKINGSDATWNIAPVKDALGTARERMGYNKTLTYDDLGIALFEKKNGEEASGNLLEVQIYYPGHEINNVSPTGNYKGALKLGKLNMPVSGEVTIAQLKKKMKGWKETNSYMDHNFRFEKKGIYIYVQFDATDSKVLKVSIGPDRS